MASRIEAAARIMEHLCTHDGNSGHGYTQGNRYGNGKTETLVIDGQTYSFAGGDRDCSSAIVTALKAAGIPTGSASYTGNMRSNLVATGLWEWKPMSFKAQRGDIYLNEAHHTAMCTCPRPDTLAQFSISENGTVYGQVGDQTGRESHIRSYYDYPWDGILHWIGGGSAATPNTPSAPSTGLPKLRYRVCVQGVGWLPEMIDWTDTEGSDDDFAGNVGKPITYLAIDMLGWYQAHSEEGGWLDPVRGYNVNDLVHGCAGDGSPITKVRAYYETVDPPSTGWMQIEYSVGIVGGGFLPDMIDLRDTGGSSDDFAGNGKRIDRFRARLVK